MLISASYDNTIKIWTEEDDDWYATETLTGHTSTVWSIALNADGSQMASCSDDGSIRLWERSNTKASSADENTTTSTTVQGSWKLKGTFAGQHSRCIYTVDWSKDG
jgi:WD40 repeat protein